MSTKKLFQAASICVSLTALPILKKVNDSNPLKIRVNGNQELALKLLSEESNVRTVSVNGNEIRAGFHGGKAEEARLLRLLVEAGVPVSGFYRDQGDLESIFMQITSHEKEKVVLTSEE